LLKFIVSGSWKQMGSLFGKSQIKSGAVLYASEDNKLEEHYLFWSNGDALLPNDPRIICISSATSDNAENFYVSDNLFCCRSFLTYAKPYFDSANIEPGNPPLRLSTGDFLFLYNGATNGHPSVKPDWDLRFCIGYAILDQVNPRIVVHRSEDALLCPELDWEIANSTDYLTPNRVFINGLIRDPRGCPSDVEAIIGVDYVSNAECFFGVYTGGDSAVGAVRIVASMVLSFSRLSS
jgi:hypothetical protein